MWLVVFALAAGISFAICSLVVDPRIGLRHNRSLWIAVSTLSSLALLAVTVLVMWPNYS